MYVTKIKIKSDRVAIDYEKEIIIEEVTRTNKYSIDSPEQPVGSFKKAFQALDFFLIELCELCDSPKDVPIMCEDVNITGLSFKYKDGELNSAIITGTKQLAYSNSPLVLNTPNKSVNIDGDFNKMVHLTDPCIAALKSALEHAKEYVNGERLQLELGLNAESPVKEADPEKFDSHKPKTEVGDITPEPEKPKEQANLDPSAEKFDIPNGPGDTIPVKEDFEVPEYSDEDGDLNKTKDVRDDSEGIDIPATPE